MQKNYKNKIQHQIYFLKKSKFGAGFTLIETLIAITILLIGIVAPMQIAANALNSTFESRDQITAYYLAAEAIEYVKNVRDTTFLLDIKNGEDNDWMFGLYKCIDSSCIIDVYPEMLSAESIQACGVDGLSCEKPLLFDDVSGMWSYTSSLGGEDSRFSRSVNIKLGQNNSSNTGEPNNDEAIIISKVKWLSKGGATKTFILRGTMMNWQRI